MKCTKEEWEKATVFCGLTRHTPVETFLGRVRPIATRNGVTGEVIFKQHGNNKEVRCLRRTLESKEPKDD